MPQILLRNMHRNQSGTIVAVKVGGELGRRIREMGLVPGAEIIIQGRAPLYDPVALRDFRLLEGAVAEVNQVVNAGFPGIVAGSFQGVPADVCGDDTEWTSIAWQSSQRDRKGHR